MEKSSAEAGFRYAGIAGEDVGISHDVSGAVLVAQDRVVPRFGPMGESASGPKMVVRLRRDAVWRLALAKKPDGGERTAALEVGIVGSRGPLAAPHLR